MLRLNRILDHLTRSSPIRSLSTIPTSNSPSHSAASNYLTSHPATHISTAALHADDEMETATSGDVAPTMHVSTTYRLPNKAGMIYSRYDTPTRQRLETVLGVLEGGHAITYASGLAATVALLHHVRPRIIYAPRCGYHLSRQAMIQYQQMCGDGVVTIVTEEQVNNGSISHIDLIWLESPNNPHCEVPDFEQYGELAKRTGAVLAVDSTLSSPIGQLPLRSPHVSYVMHSCTKYLGGHSDVLGGVLIVRNKEHAIKLRQERTVQGNVLGNMETFLLLRSLRTLDLRVTHASNTALKIAQWLTTHPKVSHVYHPFLPSHPSYTVARRQLLLPPATFSFVLRTREQAESLPRHLHFIISATSLGGVESLIDWRYQYDQTLEPALLRLSVGLEHVDDLIQDLKQALDQV